MPHHVENMSLLPALFRQDAGSLLMQLRLTAMTMYHLLVANLLFLVKAICTLFAFLRTDCRCGALHALQAADT